MSGFFFVNKLEFIEIKCTTGIKKQLTAYYRYLQPDNQNPTTIHLTHIIYHVHVFVSLLLKFLILAYYTNILLH